MSAYPSGQDGHEAVAIYNATGAGRVVLVCEHASNHVPDDLNSLGVGDDVLASHVAWDIGALGMARAMADVLDAPLVHPTVSRLVYDCNRPPEAGSAVPARSEIYDIPGNRGLSDADREARVRRYYRPFTQALSGLLDDRRGQGIALVTVHSFTPVFEGAARALDIGVLHDDDSRLADRLLAVMAAADGLSGLTIRRNEPYGPQDGVTHTLKTQALPRGLPNVMFEVRNDLIATKTQQKHMAESLARVVAGASGAEDESAG